MSKLKIAIQKKGRLHESSLKLLRTCGLKIGNSTSKLKTQVQNFPLEILFLRDDDIPKYVQQNIANIGIIGENEVLENEVNVDIALKLGFAKCRLSLAIPRQTDYESISFFSNKKIATSYPKILARYLKDNHLTAVVEEISGSVEIAPGIGLADAICDLVSSGSTLQMNGLKEVETILQSQAVLISNIGLSDEEVKVLDQLKFRINAVKAARKNKYILLNAPNDSINKIIDILPGMRSPSIIPLADPGWSSVHSVVNEEDFWNVIEKVKSLGAEGILVSSIEKMIV